MEELDIHIDDMPKEEVANVVICKYNDIGLDTSMVAPPEDMEEHLDQTRIIVVFDYTPNLEVTKDNQGLEFILLPNRWKVKDIEAFQQELNRQNGING